MDSNIKYWCYPGMAVTKALVQTAQNPELPTATRVLSECLKEFSVEVDEFFGRSRLKKIVRARRYAGFILFHFCGWSFVKLAKFVERDRTNMMHHVRVLENELMCYREEREWMYNILERLDILDLSSSGNDWYHAWSHNQMKDVDLYHNLLKFDAADALRQITTITHGDGRYDKNPANKAIREGNTQRRMETVGGWIALKRRADGVASKNVEDYVKEEQGTKHFAPKVNKYDKY
jgi:hypothetical protein